MAKDDKGLTPMMKQFCGVGKNTRYYPYTS